MEGLSTWTLPQGCCLPAAQRRLPSTPNRKEYLYLGNQKPHFPENFHLYLPQNKISNSSTFKIITRRSSSSRQNILLKHSLILLRWSQNRACFRPCPSCLQTIAQSGAMEFPFGERGRRTNPLYWKDATSCHPGGLQQAIMGGILGNWKGNNAIQERFLACRTVAQRIGSDTTEEGMWCFSSM